MEDRHSLKGMFFHAPPSVEDRRTIQSVFLEEDDEVLNNIVVHEDEAVKVPTPSISSEDRRAVQGLIFEEDDDVLLLESQDRDDLVADKGAEVQEEPDGRQEGALEIIYPPVADGFFLISNLRPVYPVYDGDTDTLQSSEEVDGRDG